jgi:hypothetical protein
MTVPKPPVKTLIINMIKALVPSNFGTPKELNEMDSDLVMMLQMRPFLKYFRLVEWSSNRIPLNLPKRQLDLNKILYLKQNENRI